MLRITNRKSFEPSYLLASAAVGFWPMHSWVWAVCHQRVHKCCYRLLFQTCIQRVTFHTSHVGNSSQEFITSIALQTSADCTGQRATEQNILLLAQSLQHVFSLHRNRKTSWKRPPGKSCKCLSKYCNQTRACPTQLCADILGLLLNEASREAPCLFEQHSTAQLFHVVCIQQWDQGKHQGSKKKEYFVSEKKKKDTIYLANSQAMSWQRRQFPCSKVLCILMINSCG